ncbi:MoaD/ThiS family protein [Thermogladius sp. 4427co]|uniref:MoaD/ThiS family protein n=1 Tax=Thermogladius sp. 4427co TaxID=3450718 RepID=UPI003F7B00BE
MRVRLFFVGEAAEILGLRFLEVELEGDKATLRDLVEKLRSNPYFRKLEEKLYLLWFLVGENIVGLDYALRDGCEITVMPPLYEGG